MLAIAVLAMSFSMSTSAETYIESHNGKYLGQLGGSQYSPNSTNNAYGRYGSKYSPDSINNPYGRYGSKYSNESPSNPYATQTPIIKTR